MPSSMSEECRVLLIEDDLRSRTQMRSWLESKGHQVEEAADGLAGLRAALERDYDVAVVAIEVPAIDGYNIARRIRAAGKRLNLIALTSRGLDRDREGAIEAGFDAFVLKPVSAEALTSMIRKSCSPAAERRENIERRIGNDRRKSKAVVNREQRRPGNRRRTIR